MPTSAYLVARQVIPNAAASAARKKAAERFLKAPNDFSE